MPDHTQKTVFVQMEEALSTLYKILIKNGVDPEKATVCANTFVNNSLEGVYTHGLNRFAKFIAYIKKGHIKTGAEPSLIHAYGGMEQWDGNSGIGITNAFHSIGRAMALAKVSGIGCVALARTNHWMRAGTYAGHAARGGFAALCWSNTIQNTPAWGAIDPRLGNNPLAMAMPHPGGEPVLLDIAMSQYSYGALDQYRMKGEQLPIPGGYDKAGNLSTDPSEILGSRRTLPIGYWKGAGLSLLLDMLATVLSGGLSVAQISKQADETNVSQVFLAFHLESLNNSKSIPYLLQQIIEDYHESVPVDSSKKVRYPGERVSGTRKENSEHGIPILQEIWAEILSL